MKPSASQDKPLSEHLEDLRGVLWRCILVWAVASVVAFCCKDALFAVVFAPSRSDFCLFRALTWLSEQLRWDALRPAAVEPHFIATELTAQFMTHLTVSLAAGLVVSSPYIIAKFYGFVAPALQRTERKFSVRIVVAGSILFWLGVLLNYFLIFPFAYRFLSTYQVQADVVNQITISSYISLLLILSLLMGVLFELPIVAYFLARMGLLSAQTMRHYRKHAFVAILIVAAVITPTGDAVTLLLVALPIYALYVLSILVAQRTQTHNRKGATQPL